MSDRSALSVAMVHHHLRGGGVTRVIANTLKALNEYGITIMIFVGEEPPAGTSTPSEQIAVVEGLTYAGQDGPPVGAGRLHQNLMEKATSAFGRLPDVWHIHNHALGKNPAVTDVAARLAAEGAAVLFQPHDFAEDGRPPNYRRLLEYGSPEWDDKGRELTEVMYPQGDHVHYAFLNGRDRKIFNRAGLGRQQSTILSNPVVFESGSDTGNGSDNENSLPDPLTEDKPLIIYPTRAIRRKNIGEMIFWATLYGDRVQFATTLSPKNPEMKPVYERWKALVKGNGLNVFFELGEQWQGTFEGLLRKADAIITTSIMEGFGLAFLEPWLVDRPVIGRNLPDITSDFMERGIELDHLYSTLQVPLKALNTDKLQSHLNGQLEKLYSAYNRPYGEHIFEEIWENLTQNGTIDFGVLDEPFQQELIEQAARGDLRMDEVTPNHLGLDSITGDNGLIERNKGRIKDGFNLADYGERLNALYKDLAANGNAGKVDYLDAGAILWAYLSSENFTLLKT